MAPNIKKYFRYFCMKFGRQEALKIAQSGHTDYLQELH